MPRFLAKNILPETELRKNRIYYYTTCIKTLMFDNDIIIIIIIIIIVSLFRNTQILFAEFCKYGKKNSGIINVDIS